MSDENKTVKSIGYVGATCYSCEASANVKVSDDLLICDRCGAFTRLTGKPLPVFEKPVTGPSLDEIAQAFVSYQLEGK